MQGLPESRSRNSAVMRTLASHQCGPGLNPGIGVICGLKLLLVLVLAPRGFSPSTLVFPSSHKPTSNFEFDLGTVEEEPSLGCGTANSYLFFIFTFIFIIFMQTVESVLVTYKHENSFHRSSK